MTTVADIQRRLAVLGYNVGPVDGVSGPITRAAVKQFQRANGLAADGIVGPKTIAALFPAQDALAPLPWMSEARRYLGLHEVINAKVLDKALNLDASEIPWCGAFAALCMGALPREPLPANPLWARNWTKFGRDAGGVYYGAVAVFKRGSGGHVGFIAGHDKTYFHLLGGNQSNRVSVTKVAKSQLLDIRWPKTFPLTSDPLPYSTFTGKVFDNAA